MTKHRRSSLASFPGVIATLLLLMVATGAAGADPSPFPEESPVVLQPAAIITGATLAAAVDAVNAEAVAQGYPLEPLRLADFTTWLDEAKDLDLILSQRDAVWPIIVAGGMPDGWGFELRDLVGPEMSVVPFYLPIVDAGGFMPYFDYYRGLLAADADLATEPWVGVTPSLTDAPVLPPSVGVRVTPMEVAGESLAPPSERDALQVEIRLSVESLDATAAYFGQGSGPDEMRRRLGDLLGQAPERWIDLKDLLPGWVGERANTFPAREDTDVCYGAAREFFYPQQDARHNRSTEASNLLLHDHYCLLPDDVAPTFGDYLNVPNIHAGRYILRDPASGRDISFSVQSGGNAPYRFYWVDEDFSVQPFGHSPDPDVFRTRIDVWRRCS